MGKDTRIHDKKEQKISTIQPTDERMTGRAGLALFEAYVRSIQIFPMIERCGLAQCAKTNSLKARIGGSNTPDPTPPVVNNTQQLINQHKNDSVSQLLVAVGNGLFVNSQSDPVWTGLYENGSATSTQRSANKLQDVYDKYKSANANTIYNGLKSGEIALDDYVWDALGTSNKEIRDRTESLWLRHLKQQDETVITSPPTNENSTDFGFSSKENNDYFDYNTKNSNSDEQLGFSTQNPDFNSYSNKSIKDQTSDKNLGSNTDIIHYSNRSFSENVIMGTIKASVDEKGFLKFRNDRNEAVSAYMTDSSGKIISTIIIPGKVDSELAVATDILFHLGAGISGAIDNLNNGMYASAITIDSNTNVKDLPAGTSITYVAGTPSANAFTLLSAIAKGVVATGKIAEASAPVDIAKIIKETFLIET